MSASWQESVFARLNEQPATPVSPSAPVPGSGRVDGVYVTSQPQSTVAIGSPISRVDGRAKVMGQARYVAEHTAPASPPSTAAPPCWCRACWPS
jgi:hypothetical protein